MEFFEEQRPVAGHRSAAVCMGPLELEIGGLNDSLAETLFRKFSPYSAPAANSKTAPMYCAPRST